MKTIKLILLFLFSTALLQAQDIGVYYVKGDANLYRAEKKLNLNENIFIKEGDNVVLTEGSIAILILKEKALVLNKPETVSYTDLLERFKKTSKSITDRYVHYLWKSAQKKNIGDESDGPLGVTGMVSRGSQDILFPPDSSIVINSAFEIRVAQNLVPGNLFIYRKKRALFSISIADSIVVLQNKGLMGKDEWFGISVSTSNDSPTSGIVYFRWASESEVQNANKDLQRLLVEISDIPKEAQEAIIDAFFKLNKYISSQTN